mgnify:CR=1 FL=1
MRSSFPDAMLPGEVLCFHERVWMWYECRHHYEVARCGVCDASSCVTSEACGMIFHSLLFLKVERRSQGDCAVGGISVKFLCFTGRTAMQAGDLEVLT